MRFDDEPPLWRDMWQPLPLTDKWENFLLVCLLALPATLVLKYFFG